MSFTLHTIYQGWQTYDARKDVLGTRHSLLSHFFKYVFCPSSVCILWRIYVYIHISDCVETVYELPLLPNNTVSETFMCKSGAARSVHWMFYHWAAGLAVSGRIRDVGQSVLQSPPINRWPKRLEEQKSIPFPVQRKLQCLCNGHWMFLLTLN